MGKDRQEQEEEVFEQAKEENLVAKRAAGRRELPELEQDKQSEDAGDAQI